MRVLFVCHGNICRSAMAELILKSLVKAKGHESQYYIDSAAVSTEEIGNPIYPQANRCLNQPRYGGPVVHRRFRNHLSGPVGRL